MTLQLIPIWEAHYKIISTENRKITQNMSRNAYIFTVNKGLIFCTDHILRSEVVQYKNHDLLS